MGRTGGVGEWRLHKGEGGRFDMHWWGRNVDKGERRELGMN